jgi:hypothetical protein
MVFYELGTQPSYYCPFWTTVQGPEMYVSFICITMLHLQLIDTSSRYLKMAKFAMNHPYLFKYPGEAFFICILQFVTSQAIEFSNILLCLMTTDTIDMISNFVAIQIVSVFDEFVYASMSDEPLKIMVEESVVEEIFVVNHTTSKKARESEMVTDNEGVERPLKVTWQMRGPKFNFFRVIYFILRCYYVSIYFYFLPFLSIMVSILAPQFTTSFNKVCDAFNT